MEDVFRLDEKSFRVNKKNDQFNTYCTNNAVFALRSTAQIAEGRLAMSSLNLHHSPDEHSTK